MAPVRQRHARRRTTRQLTLQPLEARTMLAGDLPAVVQNPEPNIYEWLFELDGSPDVDADRALNLAIDDAIAVAGRWNGTDQDYPGLVASDRNRLVWFLDTDGDPEPEITRTYGLSGDVPVVGDWDGDGVDDFGVVRNVSGFWEWYLDVTHDGIPDRTYSFGNVSSTPIAGDWDGDGTDTLGLALSFRGTSHFQLENNPAGPSDLITFDFGAAVDDVVVGDWDNNGSDDVGTVYLASGAGTYTWLLDTNHDSSVELTWEFGQAGVSTQFVAGLWQFAEIQVIGEGRNIESGDSFSFGSIHDDSHPTASFQISNLGNDDLVFDTFTLPVGFELAGQAPERIAPGSSFDLDVQFVADEPGEYTGDLLIPNNDGNEDPFAIRLAAGRSAPSMTILDGRGNELDQSGQFLFDGYELSDTQIVEVFTIVNNGPGTLHLGDAILDSPDGSWRFAPDDLLLPPSLSAGQSFDFGVELVSRSSGPTQATLAIESNSPEQPSFFFDVTASIPAAPEITVTSALLEGLAFIGSPNPLVIHHNDTYVSPLPPTAQGEPSPEFQFRILNEGNEPLTLETVTVDGNYAIVDAPELIGPGEEGSITLRLASVEEAGLHTGTVHMTTNDDNESSLQFSLSHFVYIPQS
ncbi:MAG: choice-of-anchor D domain-containing protein, partial [Planctomycetales bacterium]|nr:choice-of-anchor D domain-containing protein [Planctomycetales bacterium]